MWKDREDLSLLERLRRSLYETLRDHLERELLRIALVDSYRSYQKEGVEYSFLEKAELRPKSKKMEKESSLFNTFLVIFCEGVVPPELKNYIRFFPENSVVKKNLQYLADLSLSKRFHHNIKYFESPRFFEFLEKLLDVDYALLIQQDPTLKKKYRYCLTHFHVKIDWPIADAAEDLARSLRYVHSHLHEAGDKKARLLQNKLFEYYGCHHSVGGRRTAGLIAAQLLRRLDVISTVYVSSSESRSVYKYSEKGVSKFFLLQLGTHQVEALVEREGVRPETFEKSYLYPVEGFHIGVCEARYVHTRHAVPPEDGKLRTFHPAYSWLRLKDELLLPRLTNTDLRPMACSRLPISGGLQAGGMDPNPCTPA